MARGGNPFSHAADANLGAALGQSLGTALFGDPEARQKLQELQAKMAYMDAQREEAVARTGYLGAQTDAQRLKIGGSQRLSDLFMSLSPQPAAPTEPAIPHPVGFDPTDTLAPLPDAAPTVSPEAIKSALPSMIAAMALARGDKVPVAETLAQLPAYFGPDELARRSLIARGHTPTKDFAVTPDRADQISARDAGEAEHQAVTTANISAATQRRGQDVTAQTQRRGQNIASTDRHYVHDTVSGNTAYTKKPGVVVANEAGANVIARALGPDVVITDNARTHGQADAIYAQQHPGKTPPKDSNHFAEQGYTGFDIRPVRGMTFADARRMVAAEAAAAGGYLDNDTRDEGTHWHMVVKGVQPAKKASASASSKGAKKSLSAADQKALFDDDDGELTKQIDASGWAQTPDAGTLGRIREAVTAKYLQTGNGPEAVRQVLAETKRRFDAKQKPAPKAAAAAAPKGGGLDMGAEREKAKVAIARGADPVKIRELFKRRTGQAL